MNYLDLKDKYNKFIYDKYEIIDNDDKLVLLYFFKIEGLADFNPSFEILKKDIVNDNINKDFLNDLVFHIGMVELISYWKCAMPKDVVINAGYLNEDQIKWFKKLYFNGLGEFLYQNRIDILEDDLMNIECKGKKKDYSVEYNGKGNLLAVGGGKDSIVAINLLESMRNDNTLYVINPKEAHLKTIELSNYDAIILKRNIDPKIMELNKKGYLNGHTPFSSLVSFVSILTAYLANKKYIVLSNENSANEANVKGTNINHQYSKSYEYENDFNNYVKTYFKVDIHYFSMLRGLYELQIAKIFSKYPEYFHVFKSCNEGSKNETWNWCCNCPKCLFVYIILSPFIEKEELISIFGEDLYEKQGLLKTFIELLGKGAHKPFECVGTYKEVNLAVSMAIRKNDGNLPYLLDYYKKHYALINNEDLLTSYNEKNNIPKEFDEIVRSEIDV